MKLDKMSRVGKSELWEARLKLSSLPLSFSTDGPGMLLLMGQSDDRSSKVACMATTIPDCHNHEFEFFDKKGVNGCNPSLSTPPTSSQST